MWLWSAKPLGRGGRERRAGLDQPPGAVETAHDDIAMRAGAEAGTELAGEGEAREAGGALELGRGHGSEEMRVEIVARDPHRPQVRRSDGHSPRRRVMCRQRLGELHKDLVELQIVDGDVRVLDRGQDRVVQPRIAGHRTAHEG